MIHCVLAFFTYIWGPSLQTIEETRIELRPFLDALAVVESGGRDDAVGDHGKALGRLQIWEIYWVDAIEYCPDIAGEYQDCRSKAYAERVVVAYLLRYAPQAVKNKDFETLARIHNGGPKGHKRKSTMGYWHRVEKVLRA